MSALALFDHALGVIKGVLTGYAWDRLERFFGLIAGRWVALAGLSCAPVEDLDVVISVWR
jgi:hypothetical protein